MDISARKLSLIKWLSDVEDERLLLRVEALVKEARTEVYKKYLQPANDEDLKRMVQESEADYQAGRTSTQEEVMQRFKNRK